MKKAIKINIGGLIFHIDEDAFDKLNEYLSALNEHFGNGTEAKEIVADVESRIAELFQERINQTKQVLNISDVEDIISILGNPSDFDTEPSQTNGENYGSNSSYATKRRFYRDVDNAVFGGICSGLGAYFNADPVIFRILFVLFTFIGAAAIPVYLILWFALPAARTSAQKLEMRGHEITISNIEKTVKHEFEQVKENFKRFDARKRTRDFFEDFFHVSGVIILAILKVFVVIVGVVFTIVGAALIIALAYAITNHPMEFGNDNFHISNLIFFLQQFLNSGQIKIILLLLIFLTVIPVLCLLYFGLKLIFRFKTYDRYFWISALAIWIISAILFAIFVVSGLKNFSENYSKVSSMDLNTKKYKIIYLEINPVFQIAPV